MPSDRETIYGLLNSLQNLIKENEREDGSFRFDSLRVIVALDFAKTEIEKSIRNGFAQMD